MAKSHLIWSTLLGEREYECAFAPATALSWQPQKSRILVSGYMADIENCPVPSDPGPTLWLVDKDGQVENIKEVLGCRNIAWSNEGRRFASSLPLAIHELGDEPGMANKPGKAAMGAELLQFVPTPFPEGKECGTNFICWSPDDEYIAANDGSNIHIFAVKSKKLVVTKKYGQKKNPVSASWSASGLLYVAWSSGFLVGLDMQGQEKVRINDEEICGLIVASPDGMHLAQLVDGGRAICVRATASPCNCADSKAVPKILRGHSKTITDCCWSPCSKFLATSSFDGTLRIWRLRDGAEVMKTHPDECRLPHKIAWSSGGRWLSAICAIFGKYSYDLRTFDVGNYASLRKRKVAKVREVTWRQAGQEVRALALAPKGKTLYHSGFPGCVTARSLSNWRKKWSLDLAEDSCLSYLELTADGKLLAAGADRGPVRIVDSRKGLKKWQLEDFAVDKKHRNFYIAGLHFAGGDRLIGVHSSCVDKAAFQLFDWQKDEELWREKTTESFVISVSPSGSLVAISRYSKLALHQAHNGKKIWQVTVDFPDELLWLCDKRDLVVAYSSLVTLLDRESGKIIWCKNHPYSSKPRVAYTPTRAILAITAGSSRLVHLRDSVSGKLIGTIEGNHDNEITAMAFACGGKYLVTACVDQHIRIFSMADGKLKTKLQYPSGEPKLLALSATGKLLVANDCEKELPLWDLSKLA